MTTRFGGTAHRGSLASPNRTGPFAAADPANDGGTIIGIRRESLPPTGSSPTMTDRTQLAVFFGADRRILRWKLIPDDDAQLEGLAALPDKSVILLPLPRPYNDASCRAAIAAATGVTPPTGRCCVIDGSGEVIGVCNADPGIDVHARGQLVPSENAGVGDRYVGSAFLCRCVVISTSPDEVAIDRLVADRRSSDLAGRS